MRASRGTGLGVIVGALATGGAAMFLLDPDRGAYRRGRARDLVRHCGREARELFAKGGRDLRHRLEGAVAVVRRGIEGEQVDDEVLVERVRSEIGRATSHPHAIRVTAQQGHVALEGLVLTDEARDVRARAACVRGVREVDASKLEEHACSEHVPSLQGGARARARAGGRRSWRPGNRLAVATTGAALLAAGLGRGMAGRLLALAGGSLLTTAALANRSNRIRVGS